MPTQPKGARPMSESPFAGITIERAEALPKRVVAGREAIPNPFIDSVRDSYTEAMDANIGPDKAVRGITVPVDRKKVTVRTTVRKTKDKSGKVTTSAVQWEQAPDVTTATYLLRMAAEKVSKEIGAEVGVHIVVDYDTTTVPTVTHTTKRRDKDGKVLTGPDGKELTDTTTYNDVTLNKFKTSGGRVRIRFVGQKKKDVKKNKKDNTPEAQTAA